MNRPCVCCGTPRSQSNCHVCLEIQRTHPWLTPRALRTVHDMYLVANLPKDHGLNVPVSYGGIIYTWDAALDMFYEQKPAVEVELISNDTIAAARGAVESLQKDAEIEALKAKIVKLEELSKIK